MRTRDGRRNSGRAGGSTGRRHRREPCRGWKAEGGGGTGVWAGPGRGTRRLTTTPGGGTAASGAGRGSEGRSGRGRGGVQARRSPPTAGPFPPTRHTRPSPPHVPRAPRSRRGPGPGPADGAARLQPTKTPAENHTPPATTRARGTQCGAAATRGEARSGGRRRGVPRAAAGARIPGAQPRARLGLGASRPDRAKGGPGSPAGSGGGPAARAPDARPRDRERRGPRPDPLRPPPGARRRDQRRSGSATSTPHDGPRDRAARGTAKPSRDPGGDPKDRVRHEGSPPEGPRRRPRPSGASSPRPSLFSRAATGLPQPLPPQHLSPPTTPPHHRPTGAGPQPPPRPTPSPRPTHTPPPSGPGGARRGRGGGGLREAAGTGHTGPGRGRGGGGGGGRREGGSGGHRRLHLGGRRAQRPGRPSPRPADDPAHRTAAQAGVAGRPRAGRTPAGRALRGNPQPRLTPGRDTHPGEAIDRQATLRQA